eukprot:scaffold902_cov254-Ochromonas_danica.AAC.22
MTLLFSFQDVDMYDRDAELFEEGEWLNDTCIHFGLQCLQEQQYQQHCSGDKIGGVQKREGSVKLIDPAIVSFLRLQVEEEDEYEELSHGLALPQYDWLVLPINDNTAFNQHQGVITQTGQIVQNVSVIVTSCPTAAFDTVSSDAQVYANRPKMSIVSVPCPSQENSNDCGVYVLLFARACLPIIHTMQIESEKGEWRSLLADQVSSLTPKEASSLRRHYREEIAARCS